MIVRNWEDLGRIPNESPTHILKVDCEMECAHLNAKDRRSCDYVPFGGIDLYRKNIPYMNHYLHTHSFYEMNKRWTEELLNLCGFDVQIPREIQL